MAEVAAPNPSTTMSGAARRDEAIFHIQPKRLLIWLLVATGIFLVANLVRIAVQTLFNVEGPARHILRLFNFDAEQSLPALFSAVILLVAAALLAACAMASKRQGLGGISSWWLLALVFAGLAVDESCSIHELDGWVLPKEYRKGFLAFAWVIPYGLFVLVLLAVLGKWFLSLPARTRRLGLLAAVMYVGGALGLEIVGAKINTITKDLEHVGYMLLISVEESLEMSGVAVWIYALLEYLRNLGSTSPLVDLADAIPAMPQRHG